MTIQSALGPLFPELGRPLAPGDSPATIWGWDSLRHVDLVLTIEDTYGVALSTAEIASMRSIGDVVAVLRARGIEVAASEA